MNGISILFNFRQSNKKALDEIHKNVPHNYSLTNKAYFLSKGINVFYFHRVNLSSYHFYFPNLK